MFCEFEIECYLRAAHIVPFALIQEHDPENSVNSTNGLLLCALCDIAFEVGDIFVNEEYEIIETDELLASGEKNLTINSWISNIKDKLKINPLSKFKPDIKYLKWKIELNQM